MGGSMTSKYLLSIDPGKATGVSYWRIPEDEPMERFDFELVTDGIDGFIQYWNYYLPEAQTLVFEEYIDDGRASHELDAIMIQGLVRGTWDLRGFSDVHWNRNSKKGNVGDRLLKQHGLWLNGSDVGWTDGRDVNDSQLHALDWGKSYHRPTQKFYWPKTYVEGEDDE